jgi:O-antigen/teichoic acid export membrane protein
MSDNRLKRLLMSNHDEGDNLDAAPLLNFWRRSGQILIFHGFGLIMGYVVHLCLVKWMGSKDYGMLSYANSVTALLGVLVAFGFPVAAVKFIPELHVRKYYAELKGFLQFGGWSILFFSSFVGIILSFINFNDVLFPGAGRAVMGLALVLGLPVSTLVGWQYEICRGQHKILAISWLQHLISPAILLLSCWYLFRLHNHLPAFEVLYLMISVSFLAWFVLAVWQAWKWSHQLKHSKAIFPVLDWLKVSFPLFLTGFFLVIMAQVDILLVGSLLGPESAGIYGLSIKISGLVCVFLTAANVLAAPLYVHLYAQKKHDEMQKVACRLANFVFWPSLFVAILIVFSGREILNWFGPEFSAGYFVVLFLVVGQLVNAGAGSVGYLADLTGLHVPAVMIRGGCAGLNVVLSWFFIKFWGVTGAALATTICLVLWNLLLHRLVSSKRNIYPSVWSSLFKLCQR